MTFRKRGDVPDKSNASVPESDLPENDYGLAQTPALKANDSPFN
jgi:hypothetical protein